MTLAAMLLARAPAAAPPLPDEDIVVLGRRLRQVRFTYTLRKWRLRSCAIRKTTGDPRIDAVVCENVAGRVAERRLALNDMTACLDARKPEMLAQVAARKGTQ